MISTKAFFKLLPIADVVLIDVFNVFVVSVSGNEVLPEASNSLASLAIVLQYPVPDLYWYCLTYIGSLASSAVAISK